MLLSGCLRDNNCAFLQGPGECNLSGVGIFFLSDLSECFAFEYFAVSKRGVGCEDNLLFFAVMKEAGLVEKGMKLHLVYRDWQSGSFESILEVANCEITDPDTPDLFLFNQFFEGFESFVHRDKFIGPVDQEKIEVFCPQFIERDRALFQNIPVVKFLVPDFRCQKQFCAVYSAVPESLPDIVFVFIGRCGIDMGVAILKCGHHRIITLSSGQIPGSKPQNRYFVSAFEGYCSHNEECSAKIRPQDFKSQFHLRGVFVISGVSLFYLKGELLI